MNPANSHCCPRYNGNLLEGSWVQGKGPPLSPSTVSVFSQCQMLNLGTLAPREGSTGSTPLQDPTNADIFLQMSKSQPGPILLPGSHLKGI